MNMGAFAKRDESRGMGNRQNELKAEIDGMLTVVLRITWPRIKWITWYPKLGAKAYEVVPFNVAQVDVALLKVLVSSICRHQKYSCCIKETPSLTALAANWGCFYGCQVILKTTLGRVVFERAAPLHETGTEFSGKTGR